MKKIKAYSLQLLICAGLIIDHVKHIEIVHNLTISILWIFIFIMFLTLIVSSEQLFKDEPKIPYMKLLHAVTIILMLGFGWFVTGSVYTFLYGFLLTKEYIWKMETQQ